jgi:hypothetical protein
MVFVGLSLLASTEAVASHWPNIAELLGYDEAVVDTFQIAPAAPVNLHAFK